MASSESTYDVAVVGAGIMGLSAALYCQKAGLRVLLLEQFSFPHTRGSSHGASRITRKAYLESSGISRMMTEAHDLWNQIEAETGSVLRMKIGTLYVEENPAPNIHSIASVNDRLGYDYNILDADSLADRYGNVMSFPDYTGLLDLDGGLLRADLCCSKIFTLFRDLGGHFVDMTPVKQIRPGAPVEIVTLSGLTYHSKKLILSAGPWSGGLLRELGLDLCLEPEAVSVCYWKAKNSAAFSPDNFPCFYDVSTSVYALPAFEYPGLVKLVNPKTNEKCKTPDERDSNPNSVDVLMKTYTAYMNDHFPNLQTPPAIIERCIYTRTPDDLWIIDQHPQHDNIVILAGFSGHGFKAGPLVGKIASQLINRSSLTERYNMSEFSIQRFSAH